MLLNLAVDLYVTKCAATQACHDYYNFAYLNFQRFMCLLLVNYATDFNIMFKTGADLLEGQAVAVLCRGSNGHCPPPPRLMVCPPPQLYCPNFFCASTIAHVQYGQWCWRLETVGNYCWDNELKVKFGKWKALMGFWRIYNRNNAI